MSNERSRFSAAGQAICIQCQSRRYVSVIVVTQTHDDTRLNGTTRPTIRGFYVLFVYRRLEFTNFTPDWKRNLKSKAIELKPSERFIRLLNLALHFTTNPSSIIKITKTCVLKTWEHAFGTISSSPTDMWVADKNRTQVHNYSVTSHKPLRSVLQNQLPSCFIPSASSYSVLIHLMLSQSEPYHHNITFSLLQPAPRPYHF